MRQKKPGPRTEANWHAIGGMSDNHVVSWGMDVTYNRDDLILDLRPEGNELQVEGEV